MSNLIDNYAMIGNGHTAALVGTDGSIDWLCLPSFSDAACFAGLLGTHENGCWGISPVGDFRTARRYRGDTMVLETEFTTSDGVGRATGRLHAPARRRWRLPDGRPDPHRPRG